MDHAKVGVGVIIVRDGKVLLIRRTGAHGSSTRSVPGGYIDNGEHPSQTAARETKEETGIDPAHLPSPRFVPFDNLLDGRSLVPFDFATIA